MPGTLGGKGLGAISQRQLLFETTPAGPSAQVFRLRFDLECFFLSYIKYINILYVNV